MLNRDYYYLGLMFYRYFKRKLINNNFFKKWENRLMFFICCITAYFLLIYSIYLFLEKAQNIPFLYLRMIILSYNNNFVLLTMLVFISLKFITLSSMKFLEYTYTLPISMNVRNKSFLLFECVSAFIILLILSSIFILPFIMVFKLSSFIELLLPILFNVVTIILFSNLLFYFIITKIKLKIYFKYTLVFTSYFMLIILGYTYAQELAFFINSHDVKLNIFNYYLYCYYNYGLLSMILLFVMIISINILVILFLKFDVYIYYNEYYKIGNLFTCQNPLIMYLQKGLLRIIRHFVNLNFLITLIFLSLLIILFKGRFSIQGLIILVTLLSYEGYAKTYLERPFMYVYNVKRYYQLVEYIISPLLILGVFSCWIFCLNTLFFEEVINSKYYLLCLCSLILNVLLGIIFPAYDNNPLSPIFSIMLILVLAVILNFCLAFFEITYFYHSRALMVYIFLGIVGCYCLLWYKDWWLK